ncbi:MAG: TIGR03663 family protein [Verrucomicrobia bacterium]|nr:MAG: TIGR03663 family protein [Verrucomicrobiota bacterium]
MPWKIVIIACWATVLAMGALLRLDSLSSRPFHCDEATGARITARRMESGNSQFDPQHFHGPLLSSLAMPLCRARGETTWPALTKGSLRLVPAIAGCLLVLLPLGWRRRWGDAPMLLAAALLATSPLLVYYSRMFIHESLFGLLGALTLMTFLTKPKWGLPGVGLGLMFATRETFVISVFAWLGAAGLVALGRREWLNRPALAAAWRTWRLHLLLSLLSAALTAGVFYSDGLHHPAGVLDAVRTFFVYKTGAGHDKQFFYYLNFLTVPHKAGGAWWYGTPVAMLALLAFAASFRRSAMDERLRLTSRFLGYAALGHFLIYGLIAYKTPWLMVLPWAHVCVLAGFSLAPMATLRPRWQAVLLVSIGLTLVSQFRQTRYATGRLASDARNPFAYVPTRRDIEGIEPWLQQLAAKAPQHTVEPIAVIGSGYWPLPWYLRSFKLVGYWQEAPVNIAELPIVLCVPESTAALVTQLATTHKLLLRGLRDNVALTLFIRNDIWDAWMQPDVP